MRVSILAIGQSRQAPELALARDYCQRAERAGRGLGLSAIEMRDFKEKKAASAAERQRGEHALLSDALDQQTGLVVALDETGRSLTSRAFADSLQTWLDSATPHVRFVIGGADGLTDEMRKRADMLLALGPMTWPHLLARALLAEQIWRAVSILSNHPYHRDGL